MCAFSSYEMMSHEASSCLLHPKIHQYMDGFKTYSIGLSPVALFSFRCSKISERKRDITK